MNKKAAVLLKAACLSLLSLCVISIAPARAAGIFQPGSGQIKITSERMVMQTGKHFAEFIENVHATQKDTSVRSDRLKVYYKPGTDTGTQEGGLDKNAIERIVAIGNVTIEFQDRRAVCGKAVYTAKDNLLILSGNNPRIESKGSMVTGREITLNQETGEIVVTGDKQERVEAVFQSESEQASGETEQSQSGRTDKK